MGPSNDDLPLGNPPPDPSLRTWRHPSEVAAAARHAERDTTPEAVPTNAVPTRALPTNAVPTNAVPTNAVPTRALPTRALPIQAVAGSRRSRSSLIVGATGAIMVLGILMATTSTTTIDPRLNSDAIGGSGASGSIGSVPTTQLSGSTMGLSALSQPVSTLQSSSQTLQSSSQSAWPGTPAELRSSNAHQFSNLAALLNLDQANLDQANLDQGNSDLGTPSQPPGNYLRSLADGISYMFSATYPGVVEVLASDTSAPSNSVTASNVSASSVSASSVIANAVIVDGGLILTSATAVTSTDSDTTDSDTTDSDTTDSGPTSSGLSIRTTDGTVLAVEVAGIDRYSDIAVLVPTGPSSYGTANPALVSVTTVADLPPVTAGQRVVVVAINSAERPVAVAGEVVAVDKNIVTSDGHHLIGALLTTVRLPAGGAGALVVDQANNAIAMVVDSGNNLTTAIPLTEATRIGRSLVETGWPSPSWLGIEANDTALGSAEALNTALGSAEALNTALGETTNGPGSVVVVTSTVDGSPASLAGLIADDVIVSVDGVALSNMADLVGYLRSIPAAQTIVLEVLQPGQPNMLGQTRSVEVQLTARPQAPRP